MVLVGGRGKRLSELFPDLSKPLIPVGGRPLLDYLLESLKKHGFQKVLLLAGHRADDFRSYAARSNDFGMEIKLVVESTPLGSAGSVRAAIADVPENEKQFLVCYGGVLFEGSIENLIQAELMGSPMVIGASEQLEAADYGALNVDGEGKVTEFSPRQKGTAGFVNTGFMLCDREKLLSLIPGPEKFCSFELDLFPHRQDLRAVALHGRFYDVTVPARYAELNADLTLSQAQKKNPALVALLATVLDGGKIFYLGQSASDLLKMGLDGALLRKVTSVADRHVQRATTRDLLIASEFAVDELVRFANQSSAQLMLLSETELDETLYDYRVSEREFRSCLLDFREAWQTLKPSFALFQMKGGVRRPALFLDRDGIVIQDTGYVRKVDVVQLVPGIEDLIRKAHQKQMSVVVVTNQSGLGRGIMTWSDFDRVNARMNELLSAKGVWIDRIVAAPYFGQSERAFGLVRRSLRKPRPGLFHEVKEDLGIDLSRSVMVGDSVTDLMAAALAGLGNAYLYNSPKAAGEMEKWKKWPLMSRVEWGASVRPLAQFAEMDL